MVFFSSSFIAMYKPFCKLPMTKINWKFMKCLNMLANPFRYSIKLHNLLPPHSADLCIEFLIFTQLPQNTIGDNNKIKSICTHLQLTYVTFYYFFRSNKFFHVNYPAQLRIHSEEKKGNFFFFVCWLINSRVNNLLAAIDEFN